MGILNKMKKGKDDAGEAVVSPKATKSVEKTGKKVVAYQAHRILIRPLLSEKISAQESRGQYAFEVMGTATKIDVKNAVKAVYGVLPVKVNMVQSLGKQVRSARSLGQRKHQKKAIVILPKGKTIHIHEGV